MSILAKKIATPAPDDDILALHTFMSLRLEEVERICPVAFDHLHMATVLLGAPHDLETHVNGYDIAPTKPLTADLAAYYTYCLPEVYAVDRHAALLMKIAIAILTGHSAEAGDDLMADFLLNGVNSA